MNIDLKELETTLTDNIEHAIKEGKQEEALTLCDKLDNEFIAYQKTLRGITEDTFRYFDKVFEKEQHALAQEIKDEIKIGNFGEALKRLHRKKEQYLQTHNLWAEFIAATFSHIAKTFGEDCLYQALRWTGELRKPWWDRMKSAPLELFLKQSTFIMKYHLGKLRVEEDEEKFTLINEPCGSGGRLLQEGCYSPPKSYYLIRNAHPMTFQQQNFPVYCAHCAVWNSLLTFEWYGHPLWVFDPPKEPDDPCRIYIYKDPKYIPEKYYRLLDKAKKPRE